MPCRVSSCVGETERISEQPRHKFGSTWFISIFSELQALYRSHTSPHSMCGRCNGVSVSNRPAMKPADGSGRLLQIGIALTLELYPNTPHLS